MQQHSYGWAMTLPTGLDLSDASRVQVEIRRPSGSYLVKELDVLLDIITPEEGVVKFNIEPGDLNEYGRYEVQVADISPGRCLLSTVGTFDVNPSIHRLKRGVLNPHLHQS